ncbi:MAG TPA: DisA protein [Deltaproteobacteria bacterium]|nr:DisA protein [Deltaproteobacteria bacterium]HIJ39777.1 DisA protein [Deltaproteobacteria bacterium]
MQKLLIFISSIRWQDLVDVSLNSYILFRLYALFRNTDVFRVLIGIAFFWILQRMAVSMGLILTSWMMEGIIAVAALIVIVVFRNEIRSVFRARNIWAILWGLPHKQTQTPVEIIAESVFDMASRRIGALIVLPGREDLEEVIQKGISWDGRISTEMIKSIFWPNNPVHDGAAVIQGNRVQEVGVILPLSHRNDLPSSYGTRHRAAAGLSEITDAMVIVVSEERGSITLTKGNDIYRMKGKEDLASAIREHLGIRENQALYLKKRKIELGIAAAVSLLIVSGVWFSISRGFDAIKTFEIPIEYTNRDSRMELLNTSATSVNLYLRGSRALLRSIRPEQIQVRMDLGKAVAGTNTFSISNENISIPPGLSLKEVRPMVVDVNLDTRTTKKLPVQVDWAGQLTENMTLIRAGISPSEISLTGPKSILDNMSTLYTKSVPLNEITKTGKTETKIVIPSAFLKLETGNKDKVTVEYEVKEKK